MKRILLVTVLIVPAAASAQGAPPAAAPATYDMSCSNFHHNPDGTWNATRPMTLQPASGPIALRPSFKIKPGTLFAGFDLAAALDASCAN